MGIQPYQETGHAYLQGCAGNWSLPHKRLHYKPLEYVPKLRKYIPILQQIPAVMNAKASDREFER